MKNLRTTFVEDDGGRSKYFTGTGGDCVTRAIAIASGLDYKEIYDRLAEGNATQRRGKYEPKSKAGKRTALNGINVKRKWFKDYMKELGFEWVPTMKIGSGCKVHLCKNELPSGRLVVHVSRHSTAVIDGVIHDTFSPQRIWTRQFDGQELKSNEFLHEDGKTVHEEKRCVYGYWKLKNKN